MKKILTLLCVFLLCSAFQCDDEPLEGEFITGEQALCEQATIAAAEAALEFLNAEDSNYTSICSAYVDALEAQILACGDEDGSLQVIIAQLGDCTLDNDTTCQDAVAIKNELEVTFNASTAVNYTENCNALKEAIQDVIDICGSTAELQDQLESLGNCILTTTPDSDVVGSWLLTSWIGEEPIDLNNDGEENIDFLLELDCYNNETIVFENDDTGVVMSTSYADIEIEIVVGTTNEVDFVVNCIEEVENTNMTWVQSGNTVSITDDFGTSDWILAGNQLSITIPEGFMSSSEDGSVTIIQDLTFVYTKQ